ncbi:hypothetical protein DPMN_191440 [Dreissena polymorpha]|uniref:Uncharacterized protein n=1 Tax=Dreissena polymorpha TaxID=45954 RepID=A0A9D3Y212_DREPO|nr:hypothetical protein DPMN_191440 [Dreissena polymorpha]
MLEQQRPSTSLVGWETLEAFLKFPVPRPGIELGTSGMVDQSVTTRPPHHLSVFVNQGLCYNDDDDDDFEEAGFEPSSSKNAEKDSSTGTSCMLTGIILEMSHHSSMLKTSPQALLVLKMSTKGQSVRDND